MTLGRVETPQARAFQPTLPIYRVPGAPSGAAKLKTVFESSIFFIPGLLILAVFLKSDRGTDRVLWSVDVEWMFRLLLLLLFWTNDCLIVLGMGKMANLTSSDFQIGF